MSHRGILRIAAASFALIAAGAAWPSAQTPQQANQPQLLIASLVLVQPGKGPEYTDLQIKEVMPALKKAGGPGRQVWTGGVFGEAGGFAAFTPIESFAQFDGPSPMRKALGDQGAAALGEKISALTASRRTLLVRTRPDLSYMPDPNAPPAPLALVTEVDIVPGRRAEFEALVKKDVLPAMQQAKVRSYTVLEVVYGGTGGYFTSIGYDTYEAIGKGHPFQVALGEDGARKLEAKSSGIVTRLERFVVRYRPDLSTAAMPSSN